MPNPRTAEQQDRFKPANTETTVRVRRNQLPLNCPDPAHRPVGLASTSLPSHRRGPRRTDPLPLLRYRLHPGGLERVAPPWPAPSPVSIPAIRICTEHRPPTGRVRTTGLCFRHGIDWRGVPPGASTSKDQQSDGISSEDCRSGGRCAHGACHRAAPGARRSRCDLGCQWRCPAPAVSAGGCGSGSPGSQPGVRGRHGSGPGAC
jgi:hypothetical protein